MTQRRSRCMQAVSLTLALFAAPLLLRAEDKPDSAAKPAEKLADVFTKNAPQSLDDLVAMEAQIQKVAEKITAATVGVRLGRAQGSGVIVSADGYVLTAAHVSGKPDQRVTIILPNGKQARGKTLGMNRGVDAGLIKLDGDGPWPFCPMGKMKEVKVGNWCLATGHPGGFRPGRKPVLRLGRVVMARDTVIQTDCTLVGGDSGGPLFDMRGRVIGINSRIGRSTEWNFHVPISAYHDGWERMVKLEAWGGRPQKGGAVMGVNGEDHPKGIKVTRVAPDYPAEKAGVKEGDIIVKFQNKPLKQFSKLVASVTAMKPGDQVTIEVLRGEKTIKISMKLGRRP